TLDKSGQRRLLCRCWHLRDTVWLDDADGVGQDFVGRRFKASARHIKTKFPDAQLPRPVLDAIEKEPDKEFPICHVMMLADEYDFYKKPNKKAPYASVYYLRGEQKTVLRE